MLGWDSAGDPSSARVIVLYSWSALWCMHCTKGMPSNEIAVGSILSSVHNLIILDAEYRLSSAT